MKKIQLYGKDGVGKYALVDNADYEWLNEYRWFVNFRGYAKRNTKEGSTRFMHCEIMGKKEGGEIDHINLNKLDNRRSNLRHVTKSENRANMKKFKNNHSGYKGVYFDKIWGKWKARITKDNKRHTIGYFKTATDAAKAYDKKALELNGNYARTNFTIGLGDYKYEKRLRIPIRNKES